MEKNILIICAHPDDETLGCGGTLLKHRAGGDTVYWLIVTQMDHQRPKEVVRKKTAEIEKVAAAYGIKEYFKLGLPSTQLDKLPLSDLIERLRERITKIKPELVYLIHGGDVHTDHQIVFTATISVMKPFYMNQLGVQRVLCYETLSSTEAAASSVDRVFIPNVFNDITDYIEQKIKIMNLYQTEIQSDPFPRGPSAIRALARYRGATVGVEYAEAFMLIREVL